MHLLQENIMKKLAFQRVLLTSGIFFASAFTLSCGSPDDVNEEQSTTESVQMESASNVSSREIICTSKVLPRDDALSF
jgi:hypothetical protein